MKKLMKLIIYKIWYCLDLIISKIKCFDNIRYWIAHRTYDKYNIIKTDLKPGYYEVEERILHSLFTLLVDYVEIECSHMYAICNDNKDLILQTFFNPRQPDLGIKYLETEVEDKKDNMISKEIAELYKWWKFERPKRVNFYEIKLNKFDQELESKYDINAISLNFSRYSAFFTEKETKKRNTLQQFAEKLDTYYKDQDTQNMIKIIKYRGCFWT